MHILTPNRVAYLDYPGSGNETARHAISGGPITIMVCSFEEGDAGIVRLYGHARIAELDDSPLARQMLETPAQELKKPRQVIEVNIEKHKRVVAMGFQSWHYSESGRVADRGRKYKGPR